jgi:sulfatase maturation enzyme AslB (radical SAM superfamily)
MTTDDTRDSRALFDERIRDLFRDALALAWRSPRRLARLFRLLLAQRRAARTRREWQARGLGVPPLLIASITRRCNLRCSGCYATARPEAAEPELETTRWAEVFAEAAGLGVSIIMLAGGEPYTRPDVIDLADRFPEVVFPVFTNGLLLDEAKVRALRRRPNLIPVVSLEGPSPQTDGRRGAGVYDRCRDLLALFRRHGIFYGVSVTHRRNFRAATSGRFAGAPGRRPPSLARIYAAEPGTENPS